MLRSHLAAPMRAASALVVFTFTTVASATSLIGSGPNLAIPAPNPGEPPRVGATLSGITGTGFDGSWAAPALAPWIGTFHALGPVPASNAYPAGTTRYDFTTLAAGLLSPGTYFTFGDVDGGSVTTEKFILNAYDSSGALITTPWLEEPLAVTGTGTGLGGAILANNMPGWDWNAALGQYTIDGTTVTGGNPSIGVWCETNTAMAYLLVERTSNFANFGLSAPIPEPGTAAMVALVLTAAARLRRR